MSNYIPNKIEPKNYFAEEFLSPKDNPADYLDPLDYIVMVRQNLDAGKLQNYNSDELKQVEDNFIDAYVSLSDKKKNVFHDSCYNTMEGLTDLQISKSEKPTKDFEDHIAQVQKKINAGKFNDYTIVQLEKVEDKLKDTYFALSEKQQEKFHELYAQTFEELFYLPLDKAEKGIENLLHDYAADAKTNYQSWKGFASQSSPRISVDEQEIDAQELNEILFLEQDNPDLTLNNLLADYHPTKFEGYALGKYPRTPTLSSNKDKSFKTYCVTSLPKKSIGKTSTEPKVMVKSNSTIKTKVDPVIEYDVDLSKLELPETSDYHSYKAPQKLENVVSLFSSSKTKKGLSFLAKAALVAGMGVVVMGNYNNQVDHKIGSDYHGDPSVEAVDTYVQKAKVEVKNEKENTTPLKIMNTVKFPEKKTVAHKIQAKASGPNTHQVSAGDTVYHNLCAGDAACVKEMWKINPGVDLNNLVPGQKLNLVSPNYNTILTRGLNSLDCGTLKEIQQIGNVDANGHNAFDNQVSKISAVFNYLNCQASTQLK